MARLHVGRSFDYTYIHDAIVWIGRVYLQTNGKYKFYNAEQYYWKVQYCMFGK